MLHDLSRWLDEAINLCPEIVRPEADNYLRPLLKRCNAKSKPRFWQWLRIQLARTEETATFLSWMMESRCPHEVVEPQDSFRYAINGGTVLIDVEGQVWKVPFEKLNWALSMYPVKLRKVPSRGPKRYMLVKYEAGRELLVHRLLLDAGDYDEVEAVNGDYLDFTTARIRRTTEVVNQGGLAVRKGDHALIVHEEFEVPNLQIVNSKAEQQNFEKFFLQTKTTAQGDISQVLKIQANGDLGKRTQCFGEIVDCGRHTPLTPEERVDFGQREEARQK